MKKGAELLNVIKLRKTYCRQESGTDARRKAVPSGEGRGPRSAGVRGGRGRLFNSGNRHFVNFVCDLYETKRSKFDTLPLPPTALRLWDPTFPRGDGFLARTRIVWMPAMSFP
jgi:hypothetical protein